MRIVCFTIVLSTLLTSPFSPAAWAGRVVLRSVQAGPTPFISFLFLTPDLSAGIKSVQFTIVPKPGSVTRPVSVTYSKSYLQNRGFISGQVPEIMLPVFGLYANYLNTVLLTYSFSNGSTQQQIVLVPTVAFSDPCGFNDRIVIQARTTAKDLSYDYILAKNACGPLRRRFWTRMGKSAGLERLTPLVLDPLSFKTPCIWRTLQRCIEWNLMAQSQQSPTMPAL